MSASSKMNVVLLVGAIVVVVALVLKVVFRASPDELTTQADDPASD
jgi:hypothetical protein